MSNKESNNKKAIAILAGGNSAERTISLQSGEAMRGWLEQTDYAPWLVDVHERDWLVQLANGETTPVDLNSFSFTHNNVRIPFAGALLAIHGTPGENGMVQGYLEMMNIPFSTGDTFTEALTFHKTACKRYVADLVATPRFVQIVRRGESDVYSLERQLGYPMFVKPNASGSSVGVHKAHNRAELVSALKAAFSLGEDVLVEEAIEGTEVSCGLVGLAGELTVFPITELVSPAEFFDYTTKYDGSTDEITPARIPAEVALRIAEASRAIYRRLRCRGIARVDYMIDKEGKPYFLEINTVPGMTKESIVPKQVRAMGQTMPGLLGLVVRDMLS